ncbi:S8 family serine peptidase [Nonomuraea sp. NPDC050643]|uniref:S8 family peptidase n=1 Tax=Nonomuraea sp. NPDC050643 TaxID=3155660 RepID=UPI0033D5A116
MTEQDSGRITLITGDVVTYAAAPDGSPRAEVDPAPRPGGQPVFFMSVRERDAYYVYPTDVLDLVAAGRLDRGLFDVAYLAANGYTDAESPTLPLIVQQPKGIAAARALPSIDGAAVSVDKKSAGRFWSTVATAKAAAPGKIWLDRKVQVTLDQSVRQIGAPQAWAAGLKGQGVKVAVLDTGIDATHPDVAGRIAGTANFSVEQSAQDGHGHGTHVASILAGNGAKYTGVAPEASLLIGKVLNNLGGGRESDVIAGMQWAASQGARVISMSLGSCCPEPGNPLDQAVDRLSAESGALFVVAAGNDAENRRIGSPGTAPSALTVGAVDRSDKVAPFSSRGPTAFAYALKPDISAPGVDIVAARARGTSMGSPVDAAYTAASGTSMATPHVAGAAALLAGQHPDWTNTQLKAALTSSAHGDGRGSYEQGAGRVDVARAIGQRVRDSGALDYGFLSSPQNGPVTKTLTYTNDGDQPVTLALKTGVAAHRGGTVPERTLTVDQDSVTVPARGTASVAVTFDPSGPDTWYEGFVRASAGDVQVTTAVGAFVEPKKVTVRTRLVLPDGANSPTAIPWMLMRTDDRDDLQYAYYPVSGAESEIQVYPGTYGVFTALAWRGEDGQWVQSLPVEPETEITKDTTITLDLRRAERVSVDTPRASEVYASQYALRRAAANGVASVDVQSLYPQYGLHEYVLLPTGRVTQGSFTLAGRFQLGAPAITMKVHAGGPEITPRYMNVAPETVKLDGRRTFTVAFAGNGTDYTGLDVRGRLALIDLSDLCPATTCRGNALDRVKAAQQAGAAGVLAYGAAGRAFLDPAGSWALYPIPTMSLTAEQGRALAAGAGGRPVTVTAEGVATTPYLYSLMFPEHGRIPADLGYTVKTGDLREIEDRFHSDRPGVFKLDTAVAVLTKPGKFTGTYSMEHKGRAQATMTEYVGPVSPDLAWTRAVTMTYDEGADFHARRGAQATAVDVFDTAGSAVEAWGIQPRVPGNVVVSKAAYEAGFAQCFPCRTDDSFLAAVPVMGPEPGHQEAFTYNARFQSDKHGGNDELRLYRDGREIPLVEAKAVLGIFAVTVPTFPLAADEAAYRLTDRFHTPNPSQLYAKDVESAWTFRSQRPTGGLDTGDEGLCLAWFVTFTLRPCEPVRRLNLRYDVPLDLDNRIRAGVPHRIGITGYHGSFERPDAKVTELKVWLTFDDGAHWTPAPASVSGRVVVSPPALAQTTGAVGIRVQAADAEGNTVEQTVHRAYGLK